MFVNDPSDFEFLEIGLASPDRIRYWSYGEIEKPETINYRTFKPERKGLFCEKIFGPVKDWECSCGKYRRIRYRGIVCERCGVEVTHSKVRRERMGHLELAAPVTHIWFLKGIPSYLGIILDISSRQLEEVIYYDAYIITDVKEEYEGQISKGQLISTFEYIELKEKIGDGFKAAIGASAIKDLLANLNLQKIIAKLREDLATAKGQKKLKIVKRLRVLEALNKSGNQPEWLVLDVIPVMPPDLRPMVQLEGGRFATSDLNDLYRRVVNRNNRLKRLMDIGAPEMIIRNEKRMLQESIDVLISNGKRGRAVTGSNGRPLKSLGNIIEGKQGRFRQNLLGKRVDYSARSVIVVGPHLDFSNCGLPKEMALELFKPFIIRKLVEDGISSNVKSAKRKIEKRDVIIWSVLEKVIRGKLVLLNRAPTLHRLGIQAFQPILVEGSAIQVHPLVCAAFNADFDGDQMAVHLPLSLEAQAECKLLIQSTNNILSPSSGRAISTPTQDMVLGLYYLTIDNEDSEQKEKIYINVDEAQRAFESRSLLLQDKIRVKISNKFISTTMGRVIFNEAINSTLNDNKLDENPYINHQIGKKELGEIVYSLYTTFGSKITSEILNNLKEIGFKYATLSGISISVEDLTIPESKPEILEKARLEVEKITSLEEKGVITTADKKTRSSDLWRKVTHQISDELSNSMGKFNNVYIMANSGARGNMDQVRQLAGMRGLMSDSQGRTIEIPIRSNFKEGLTLTEYFISAYGARKGLVDTALRTADSGYLTRRLVDVAQDIMISMEDCGTKEGIKYTALKDDAGKPFVSLGDIVEGRIALETINYPNTKKPIVKNGEMITRDKAKELDAHNVSELTARSPYMCKAERGVCQSCYGIDLSTAKTINLGEAVGIIAAQSIGEPGTQLTMRTFHTGGVDLRKASMITFKARSNGKISFKKDDVPIKVQDGKVGYWVIPQNASLEITGKDASSLLDIPAGAKILVKDKDNVLKDDVIAEYDPNDLFLFSSQSGTVFYDEKLVNQIDQSDGSKLLAANNSGEIFVYDKNDAKEYFVSKINAEKHSVLTKVSGNVLGEEAQKSSSLILSIDVNKQSSKKSDEYKITAVNGAAYAFSKGSILFVKNKDKVNEKKCIAMHRLSGDMSKTEDIVQGLPKVEELFEARKPKEAAVLSEIDGVVDLVNNKTYWSICVIDDEGNSKEYKVSKGNSIKVSSGQFVKKGEKLSHGQVNPHDLATTRGIDETRKYLSDEIQKVYCSQGVQINKKHIEIIVRQMTMKATVSEMGEGTLLLNEMVDIRELQKINEKLKKEKKKTIGSVPVLLGITRASLSTKSFISASSFQQTASVLTRASIEGQKDNMYGLKENVIIGKLIPAGTGAINTHNVLINLPVNEEDDIDESNQVPETESENKDLNNPDDENKKNDKEKKKKKKEKVADSKEK